MLGHSALDLTSSSHQQQQQQQPNSRHFSHSQHLLNNQQHHHHHSHIDIVEPKRSIAGCAPIRHCPIPNPIACINNGITSSNNNSSNSNNNNSNNCSGNTKTPPADANQKFLLAPARPLRRCRSASPVPNRPLQLQNAVNGGGIAGLVGAGLHHQLLSQEQQAMIRKSWLKISKTTFGASVFEKMIERSPAIERLFSPPADPSAIARHERYFTDLAQWAVDGMAEPERMLGNWLEMVGRGHGQFRVKRAHWDYLGEALTEAVCQSATITGRQRRDTVHAWRILLSFLADRLGNTVPPGQPDPFNRIHLLQLVSDGPRIQQQQQSMDEKEQKTP